MTDFRRVGLIRPKTDNMTEIVSAAVFPASDGRQRHARFSLMQDEHGPHAFADDEIALPVTHVGAIIDLLWAVVD